MIPKDFDTSSLGENAEEIAQIQAHIDSLECELKAMLSIQNLSDLIELKHVAA